MISIPQTCRAAFAAAVLALSTSACAYPGPTTMAGGADCFSVSQWRGWSSPVDDVIYLRVGNSDVWRVDLTPGSGRNLDRGGDFLISEVRGSSRICTANDLDIAIGSQSGFRTPLFPRTLRKLTPEEVAALPPGHKPG